MSGPRGARTPQSRTERGRPATSAPAAGTGSTRWGAVVAIAVAIMLGALDMTIAAVALPSVSAEFDAPPAVTQWVMLAYFLPMVGLGIPIGRWVDRAGLRATFFLATIGFGAASLLVMVAPTLPTLLGGRAVQGFFAALMTVLAFPVIGAATRPEHRARAMSVILTLIPLSAIAGPGVGGLLTEALGWRSVFAINLPIVFVAIALGRRSIPDVRPTGRRLPVPERQALGEALALGVAVGTTLLALDRLGRDPAAFGVPLALAVVGGAVAVGWWRHPGSRPVVAFLHRAGIARQVLALTGMTTGFGATYFLVPYHLDAVLGQPASTTGLVLLVMATAMAVTTPLAGMMADRRGTQRVSVAGAAITLVGMASLALLDGDAQPLDVAWRLAVIGVGSGLFFGPNAAAILAATPAEFEGTAGGVTELFRTLGLSLGPALGALAWGLSGGGSAAIRVGALGLSIVTAAVTAAVARSTSRAGTDRSTA